MDTIIDYGIRLRQVYEINIEEFYKIYAEVQQVKQEYHRIFWMGFMILDYMSEELKDSRTDKIIHIVRRISYSIEDGIVNIINCLA